MRDTGRLRRVLAVTCAATTLGLTLESDAALVTQQGPTVDSGVYGFGINITRNDSRNYDSLTIDTSHLFDQLASANGETLAYNIGQAYVDIGNSGDVVNGWSANFDAAGDIEVTNELREEFFEFNQIMQVNFTVPSALAPDGIGYGEANPELVTARNVGSRIGITFYYGSANNYVLLPEPTSLALLGIGGMLLTRRSSRV